MAQVTTGAFFHDFPGRRKVMSFIDRHDFVKSVTGASIALFLSSSRPLPRGNVFLAEGAGDADFTGVEVDPDMVGVGNRVGCHDAKLFAALQL